MTDAPRDPAPLPGLASILQGKRILLTGATGFLAKVVLEKLIRTVPDVGAIVLLIRGGPDGDADERFQRQVAGSSIFDPLRRERGAWLERFFAERVECVTGDVSVEHLGLGAAGFAALAARLDLVVNAAASVDFREPLDRALAVNTLSLVELTRLARLARAPLLQVSTCYVNGTRRGDAMEEGVRPAGRHAIPRHEEGWYEVGDLLAGLARKIAQLEAKVADPLRRERALTALGIREAQRHGWNDTYTFTKWLGEQLAMRGMRGRPLSIVRPSIVESTLRDPAPGWLEGVKVADAVILAYARGRTSLFPARPEGIIDVIPADLVANAILLAAGEALADPGPRRIYQCCSGARNPITLGEFIRLLQGEAKRNWRQYDKLFLAEPRRDFRVVGNLRFRLAMAAVAAGVSLWSGLRRLAGAPGETPAMEKLRTTRLLAITFSFYAQPRCRFDNRRLLALAGRFGGAERERYPVDAAAIDWEDYLCRIHLPGLNRYALKRKEARAAQAAADMAAHAPQAHAQAVEQAGTT